MQLGSAEKKILADLESEKGAEWVRYRARRNQWMRKNCTEAEAVRRALEPLLPAKLLSIGGELESDSEPVARQFDAQDIILGASIAMLLLLTGYQIYAQHAIYAKGIEGWFLATTLELILVIVAMLPARKIIHRLAKLAALGMLILHMLITLETTAFFLSQADDDTLAALRAEIAMSQKLYDDLPENRITDRRNVLQNLAESNRKLSEYDRKHTETFGSFLGNSDADIKARIRWINFLAQLFFAHLVGGLILRRLGGMG